MSAQTWDVLPADSGQGLPEDVRRALVDFGTASNNIAVALNLATIAEIQAIATGDSARAGSSTDQVAISAGHMAEAASSFADQLIVIYAGVTTKFAAYAARTATSIAAGQTPTTPTAHELTLLPSQLLSALETSLPPVRFAAPDLLDDTVADQNNFISDTREQLMGVVTVQLFDSPPTQYDDPSAVARRPSTAYDLVIEFPNSLHAYAATLTWAAGVFTGTNLQE